MNKSSMVDDSSNMAPQGSFLKPVAILLAIVTIGVVAYVIYDSMATSNRVTSKARSMDRMHDVHFGLLKYAKGIQSDKKLAELSSNNLSWRVYILPYVGHQELFQEFKLDESWDSDHNKTLISRMPGFFKSHPDAENGKTSFLIPSGPQTAFDNNVLDLSDTLRIVLLEVDDDFAVTWTKPADWKYDPKNPIEGVGKRHNETIIVGYAHGGCMTCPIKKPLVFVEGIEGRSKK